MTRVKSAAPGLRWRIRGEGGEGDEEGRTQAVSAWVLEGRERGKKTQDFFKVGQEALEPFQPGLFDDLL